MAESSQQCIKLVTIILGAIVGMTAVLIAISFGYLDYYDYGFRRQKSTSRVFTGEVYKGGRHLIGPDFEFKTYPASAVNVEMDSITVFSKDRLPVTIGVQFQYFLRPEQLSILHRKYQLTYDSVVRSSAIDALKAAAANFTTENFIRDRNDVEIGMRQAVKMRLGGNCCEADCGYDICFSECIPMKDCRKEEDVGMMVTMRYFAVTSMSMPDKVYQRYLKSLLLVEESQMEKYRLEEAVVKKEVDEVVKTIDNQATEVAQNSTAEAGLITRRANAEALKIVGAARSEGLNSLMSTCGITDEKKKMSLHYLSSLGSNSQVHMAVDFNNYVIGSGK